MCNYLTSKCATCYYWNNERRYHQCSAPLYVLYFQSCMTDMKGVIIKRKIIFYEIMYLIKLFIISLSIFILYMVVLENFII